MTSHDWSDRLGGYDALVDWFKDAREADPNVKLTYNDYGILSRDSGHQNYHYELCKYLAEHDAPMTTIGIQGHVSLISPIEIINILDRFSELGKEIEITEFTYEDDDPKLQAQFTRDFMIAVFSEEAVTSLTTWGFWEGCMYQPKAAMVDNNFNLKPNGEVWRDLIYNEWWTNEAGVTGENGIYNVRAFMGDHDVTVRVGDAEYSCPVELGKDGAVVRVILDENGNLTGPETHVHQFGTEWESDDTNHWHVCGCGEKADVEAHTAGEWIVDKEATAEEDGSRHKECTVCGATMERETIPKTGTAVKPGDGDNNGGNGNGGNNGGNNNNSNKGDKNTANSGVQTVKTGDTGNAAFWLLLIVMSGTVLAGGVLAVKLGRKRRR